MAGPHLKLIKCPEPRGCYAFVTPTGPEIVIEFRSPASLIAFTQTTAVIRDPSLAFTYDRETAMAELPYVNLESSPELRSPFTLHFSYGIPDAGAYDWSQAPLSRSSNEVAWAETINPSGNTEGQAAQAAELTGANHIAQAADNQGIFFSGILFGIAGAAALAAVVEFLHLIFKVA